MCKKQVFFLTPPCPVETTTEMSLGKRMVTLPGITCRIDLCQISHASSPPTETAHLVVPYMMMVSIMMRRDDPTVETCPTNHCQTSSSVVLHAGDSQDSSSVVLHAGDKLCRLVNPVMLQYFARRRGFRTETNETVESLQHDRNFMVSEISAPDVY